MTTLLETGTAARTRRAGGRAARGPARCRPVTVFDLMILVAATAVGLGLDRSFPVLERHGIPARWAAELPCLAAWTFAAFVLRLRRPRPAFPFLMRQPGAVASLFVVLLVAVVGAFGALALGVKSGLDAYGVRTGGNMPLNQIVLFGVVVAGAGVTGAWFGLALSGRRRTEPGWIDLLGRAVGTLWVTHLGVGAVLVWLHFLPR